MSTKDKRDQVPLTKVPTNERITKLKEHFCKEYGCEPSFFVRVPGRVNLIGEHIDYCGYPVLPMALEQDIIIAAGILDEPTLHVRNINSKYSCFETKIKCCDDIKIVEDVNGKPFWYNYVLCGVKGALEHLNDKIENGLQLCIDGIIPPASGLSSSSALVSAACLALLHAQNVPLSKTDIASLCAKCERYIGTQGGGMDQAIAFLAEKYCAQYITWKPLNATPVALPENASFVVAHSLAEANKAATNDFNRRVIECRLAAKIIAACEGVSTDKKIITLSELQNKLGYTLEKMIKLVHTHLPNELHTKDEISKILDINNEELEELYLTPNTKHLIEFKLKQRALHVFEEAMRVEDFRKHCSYIAPNSNGNGTNGVNGKNAAIVSNGSEDSNLLNILGNLMSSSHQSLRDLYECSHDNLDRLVNISKEMKVHSRLTGAGWGGCIIALCPKEKVDEYINTLIDEFYVKHCKIDRAAANSYIFATTPNHGAEIYVAKLNN